MMFSDTDIKAVLKNGKLGIDPFNKDCVRPSGIVLHLGQDLLKPLPGAVVDVKNNVTPDYEKYKI